MNEGLAARDLEAGGRDALDLLHALGAARERVAGDVLDPLADVARRGEPERVLEGDGHVAGALVADVGIAREAAEHDLIELARELPREPARRIDDARLAKRVRTPTRMRERAVPRVGWLNFAVVLPGSPFVL